MTPPSLKYHPITTKRLDVGSHRTPSQHYRPTSNQIMPKRSSIWKADMLTTNHGLKPPTGVLRYSAPKNKAQRNDLFINNPRRVTIPDFCCKSFNERKRDKVEKCIYKLFNGASLLIKRLIHALHLP
ncbi:expressed protein [Echinococcus multilocularis]|uniref:Expressed protein n=1 Tax=Echinococcus multilocularis TaxID=6211 RepID=A0A068YDB4_ECHMU|nr:expressed protein [Echinococcus multilocularis]